MLLHDLLNQLTFGELFQLEIGGNNELGIQPVDFPKVIPHINLGLIELYKRFPLKIDEVIIEQYDQIQTYYLRSKYAQSNIESKEPIKYIADSIYKPFKDGVLRIETVYNELGEELFVNDNSKQWSVFTPSYDSIQIPMSVTGNAFTVGYRASHEYIHSTALDDKTYEVDIPVGLLEPLLLYIASRMYASLNFDGSGNEGMSYYQKFEAACNQVEKQFLYIDNNTPNMKLDIAGWV